MKMPLVLGCFVLSLAAIHAPPAVRASGAPAGTPAITITNLRDGAVLHGSSISVQVSVSHFKLVPPVLLGPSHWKTIPLLKGNQGHIHYVLDSLSTLVLTRDVTTMETHTWTNVSPGRHTVIAYLATSQHALFPGTKEAVVHVTVMAAPTRVARPAITITSPPDGATVHGSVVTVHTQVSHFKLVPPVFLSPPLLPGNQGHIHYVLDSMTDFTATRDAATMLSHSWENVSPGRHTITAYLATSQHAPFPGARSAVIHINVAPALRRENPAPSISITKLDEVVSGTNVTVVVHTSVSHFKLVPPVYTHPRLLQGNQGHIHYVLDGLANFQATRDATNALQHPWTNVSPGMHTIYAYLANSQHQRFPHTPVAQVNINVPRFSPSGGTAILRIGAEPKTGGGVALVRSSPSPVVFLLGCLALFLGLVLAWYRGRLPHVER